jgi:hypothetical protein
MKEYEIGGECSLNRRLRTACADISRKPEGKRTCEKSDHRWRIDINIRVKDIGCEWFSFSCGWCTLVKVKQSHYRP